MFNLFSGTMGYILSLDWFGLFYRGQQGYEILMQNHTKSMKTRNISQKMVHSHRYLIAKEILTHLVFFSINLVVIMIYTPNFEDNKPSETLEHMNTTEMTKISNITSGKDHIGM